MDEARPPPPRAPLEVLRLLLVQVAVLSLVLTAAIGARTAAAGTAFRVLASAFVVSVEVLALLTLRTAPFRRAAALLFVLVAVVLWMRGFPSIAWAAVGGATAGLVVARWRPAVRPSSARDREDAAAPEGGTHADRS